jgi:hypothetical protein
MTKRQTIVDVAKLAGVSTAVVSYALNGRPGVSDETRKRVLQVAAECGWRPSSAARSLRTGPTSIGLVLPARGGTFGGEDDLLQFVGGLQAVLSGHRVRALLHLAEDHEAAIQVCTDWWAEREVTWGQLADLAQARGELTEAETLQSRRLAVNRELGDIDGIAGRAYSPSLFLRWWRDLHDRAESW